MSSAGLRGATVRQGGEGLEGEEVGGRVMSPQTPALFSHIRTPEVLSISRACTGQLRPPESVSSEGPPAFHG